MNGLAIFVLIFLCAGLPYLLFNHTPITSVNLMTTYDYFLGMFLSMFIIANISIQIGYWLARLFNAKNIEEWAGRASILLSFLLLPFVLPPYLDWLAGTKMQLKFSDYSPLLLSADICPVKFSILWNRLVELFTSLGINGTISNLIALITVTGSFLRGFEAVAKFFQSHKSDSR